MPSLLRNGKALSRLSAASLTILSNTLISPALPGLKTAFKGQPSVDLLVPLLVTAPSIMVAIVSPFAGMLADRFGRKRQLLIGVMLFAFAGSAGLWLNSLEEILVSRLLLGVSVALIMTAQTLFIGDYFKGDVRTRFMGMQIAATNLGGLVFVVIAGWLAGLSAFLPFAIYLIALLYLPLMWMKLTEQGKNKETKEPIEGAGGQKGWPFTLALVAVIAMLSLTGFYLIPTQAPFFLAKIDYTQPSAGAIMLATLTLAGGLASLFYSSIRGRFGRSITSVIGFALFAGGYGILSIAGALPLTLFSAVLLGGASGLLFPIFLTIGLDVAPPKWRGLASGIVMTSIFLGQFLSPITALPLIKSLGFSATFGIVAGMYVILGIIGGCVFKETNQSVVERLVK